MGETDPGPWVYSMEAEGEDVAVVAAVAVADEMDGGRRVGWRKGDIVVAVERKYSCLYPYTRTDAVKRTRPDFETDSVPQDLIEVMAMTMVLWNNWD